MNTKHATAIHAKLLSIHESQNNQLTATFEMGADDVIAQKLKPGDPIPLELKKRK